MARLSSVRLFTGYRLLNSWFRKLDLLLHEACDQHLMHGSGEPADLPNKLRTGFLLRPLEIACVMDVAVDAYGYKCKELDGVSRLAYRASARIPYKGSRMLLRTAPEPGFTFPFKGRVGAKSMHLDTILPSMDPTAFVADAGNEVERVAEALQRSYASIHSYNDRIEAAIDSKLRAY